MVQTVSAGVDFEKARLLPAIHYPTTMDLPGYRLHELRGNRRGSWSVRVSGNTRVTFRFASGRAVDIDLEDYH